MGGTLITHQAGERAVIMFVYIAKIEVSLQGEILMLFCILLSASYKQIRSNFNFSMHVIEVRNGPPKLAGQEGK